jgi:RimJ/RimL family protein N-acetyltransferase
MTLETERLVLRPFAPGDLDAFAAIDSLPEAHRYRYTSARALDETREVLAALLECTELCHEGDRLEFAIELRETGAFVGEVILFWRSEEHRQGEVGFVVDPRHHGRGYATEAAREMLRLGFEHYGWHRIYGRLDGRNGASARVLERLGMRREAHLVENEWVKGEWADEVIYALLDREWRARLR